MAELVAGWSQDPGRKIGAIIAGPDNEIRAIGYNWLPRGIDGLRDVPQLEVGEAKYLWIEHAERNALYAAARVGIPVNGCRMYMTWFPCMDCARAIVQSGIIELIGFEPDLNEPRWGENFRASSELLRRANIKVRIVNLGK